MGGRGTQSRIDKARHGRSGRCIVFQIFQHPLVKPGVRFEPDLVPYAYLDIQLSLNVTDCSSIMPEESMSVRRSQSYFIAISWNSSILIVTVVASTIIIHVKGIGEVAKSGTGNRPIHIPW
jgi:hypothetical protein